MFKKEDRQCVWDAHMSKNAQQYRRKVLRRLGVVRCNICSWSQVLKPAKVFQVTPVKGNEVCGGDRYAEASCLIEEEHELEGLARYDGSRTAAYLHVLSTVRSIEFRHKLDPIRKNVLHLCLVGVAFWLSEEYDGC